MRDVVSGIGAPRCVALDLVAREIYWTDVGVGRILRSGLGGLNVQEVVTGINPAGIALDLRY